MTFEQVQARINELIANKGVKLVPLPSIPGNPVYEVVWTGRDPLLPERDSCEDGRLKYVPSYDLDEGQAAPSLTPKRKYTLTGNHSKGKRAAKILSFPTGEPINEHRTS